MKRIFIAVGSEATRTLSGLINRLCEENLFTRFDDRYIAIDSMQSEIDTFNQLGGRLNTGRIWGEVLTFSPEDELVTKSFRPTWTTHSTYAGGVGGDRTVSAKAGSIIRQLWNNPDLALDADLGTDDQICVVGSAFGGTAGGLFLNVCEYLDYVVRIKRKKDDGFKNVQIVSFLLMPDGERSVSAVNNYPVALNMVDMFKDLQQASWRRRLESDIPGFKVPTWSQLDGNAFPLFTGTTADGAHMLMEYGVQGSSLPMSDLYVIPTPSTHKVLMNTLAAETIFLATYLQVSSGHGATVDRVIAQFGVRDYIENEDHCLSGFNFFAMKSGHIASLKYWFYDKLVKVFDGEDGTPGLLSSDDSNQMITGNIKQRFTDLLMPGKSDTDAGISDDICLPLKTLKTRFFGALLSHRNLLQFSADLPNLLRSVENGVPSYATVPMPEMLVILASTANSGWNHQIDLTQIEKAYKSYFADYAQRKQEMPSLAAKLEKAVKQAITYSEMRSKSRVIASGLFGLDQEDAVFGEITDALKTHFMKLLKSYLVSCRCNRSSMLTEGQFSVEITKLRQKCMEMRRVLTEARDAQNTKNNPFVVDGILDKNLRELPENEKKQLAFDPLRITLSVVYRSLVCNTEENTATCKALRETGDAAELLADPTIGWDCLLGDIEATVIGRYLQITEKLLPVQNPLSGATLADFRTANGNGMCKTFANEFKVADSGNGNYHFVINLGQKSADFKLTNADVAGAPLNLTTMPNTANGAQSFLAESHALGMTSGNFWKDENATGRSCLFAGIKDPQDAPNVNALWIGTLGSTFTVHDVLDRIYRSDANAQTAIVRYARNSPVPRSLMSLGEMLRFGVIMNAVELGLQEAWQRFKSAPGHDMMNITTHGQKVSVVVQRDGQRSFEVFSGMPLDVGLVDSPECSFASISVEMTGRILAWIRNSGSDGFAAMFPAIKFQEAVTAEGNIFVDLHFSVSKSVTAEIARSVALVKDAVVVKGF